MGDDRSPKNPTNNDQPDSPEDTTQVPLLSSDDHAETPVEELSADDLIEEVTEEDFAVAEATTPPATPGAAMTGQDPAINSTLELDGEMLEEVVDEASSDQGTMEVEAVEVLEEREDREDGEEEDAFEDSVAVAIARAEADDPRQMEQDLSRELEAENDRPRKALVQHELGHLYFARLNDESQAVKAYALALKLDPRLRPNFWAIRRVFVARCMWPSLIKLLEAQLRYEKTPRRKAEILLEKGWVMEADGMDRAGAASCFHDAHKLDPRWLPPLLALEKAARAAKDLPMLETVYEAMAESVTTPRRKAAILIDLALLKADQPDGGPEKALELLDLALESEAPRSSTLRTMEGLAREHGLTRRRADILARQAQALMETDLTDPSNAAALLREAANLCRHELDDLDGAAEHIRSAIKALPGMRLLLEDLLSLARARNDWQEAEEVLIQLLEQVEDEQERADIWNQIGVCRLNRGEDAEEAAEQATAILPGFLPIQAERERNLLMDGETEGLVELYRSEAAAVIDRSPGLPYAGEAQPNWAATLYWRAAALSHYQLDDQTAALELCQKSLALVPELEPANHLLEDLLRATGAHKELADLLEKGVEASEGEHKALLLEELIALYGGALDQPERQLAHLKTLCSLRDNDARPLRLMVSALGRAGKNEALVEVLEALEKSERDPDLKVGWMLERARLLEGPLEQPEQAAAVYRAIVETSPEQPYAFTALEQVLTESGQHKELASHLRNAIQGSQDEDERLRLRHRLLEVLEQDLDEPEEAAEVAAEILAEQPEDLAGIVALTRLAEAAEDMESLAQALEARIARTTEATPRVLLKVRLAGLFEDRLDQPERAEELFTEAVDEAPDTGLVLGALEALIWRKLAAGQRTQAATLLGKVRDEVEGDLRPRILEEMAWLAEDKSEEAEEEGEEPEDLWANLLEQAGEDHLPALWGSLRQAARRRDTAKMSTLYASLAKQCGEHRALGLTFRLRAAMLAEVSGEGDDSMETSATLREVLEAHPGDPEALLGLLARDELEAGDRADLMVQLGEMLEGRQREQHRLPLALSLEDAGRLAAAMEEIRPLLEAEEVSLSALLMLERLARAAGDRKLRVAALIKLARAQAGSDAEVAALRQAAGLLEEEGRPEEAVAMWRQVLGLEPDDDEAYHRLHTLYEEQEDLESLYRLLEHQIGRSEADQRVGLLLERARLRLDLGEDAPAAARDLLRVLELEPTHAEALNSLAQLYEEDRNTDRALELYRRLAETMDDRQGQRKVTLKMAELLGGAGHRSEEATQVFETYLEQNADDQEALQQLSDLYLTLSNPTGAVGALERLGKLKEDPAWQKENLRRIAGIYWQDLGDLSQAEKALRELLAGDPLDLDLVRDLQRLLREKDAEGEVEPLLKSTRDAIRQAMAGSPLSVELVKKLAEISEWREDQYTLMATLGVLGALRATSKAEDVLFLKALKKVSQEPGKDALEAKGGALVHAGARLPFGDIWRALALAIPKLHPGTGAADVSTLGVGRSDKIDRRSGGQLTVRIEAVAAAVGMIYPFDIYLSSKDADLIAGVPGDAPALVVGHGVVSKLDAGRRFRLGKTLYLMRDQTLALEQLKVEQARRLLCAAIFSQNSKASLPLPAAELKVESKKLVKVLPRKLRKQLSAAVKKATPDLEELEKWMEGVVTTANRAGLLVSGHVIASVQQLEKGLDRAAGEASLTTDQVMERLRGNEQAANLLVFSLSEEYLGLRRELRR